MGQLRLLLLLLRCCAAAVLPVSALAAAVAAAVLVCSLSGPGEQSGHGACVPVLCLISPLTPNLPRQEEHKLIPSCLFPMQRWWR